MEKQRNYFRVITKILSNLELRIKVANLLAILETFPGLTLDCRHTIDNVWKDSRDD